MRSIGAPGATAGNSRYDQGRPATVSAASAGAREAQVLPDADVRAIISAAWEVDAAGGWEGDLGRIVLVSPRPARGSAKSLA